MNNQTITEVSRVTFISGAAKVRTPDGELHDLKVGDILQPGTEVILADASVFVVEATSSEVPGAAAPEAVASTELPADQQPSMPAMGAAAAAGDDVLAQINQMQQAILAGDDPTQAFEAAAAGVAANAGGRGPGSGNSGFIAVDRVGNATIAAAGYDTAARGAAPIAHFDEPAALMEIVNRPTRVAPDTNTVKEDTPATGNVLANDSDPDDALSVVSFVVNGVTYTAGTEVTLPGIGVLVINANGSYVFTPNDNWNGSVPEVTYTTNTQASSTLNITVEPVNDDPIIVDENGAPRGDDMSVTTPEDKPVSGTLLAVDPDNDILSFSKGSDPTHGTVVVNSDGSWTYVPNDNYNGDDSFTAVVSDGHGGTDTITVNIIVTPVNDIPVAVNDSNSVQEDATVSVPLTGVLSNDSDIDGDTLTVTGIRTGTEIGSGATGTVGNALTGTYGTLILNANGSYSYVADQAAADALAKEQSATDIFTYTIDDGNGGTDTAQLVITITGTNDGPIFDDEGTDDTGAVIEDLNPVEGYLKDSGSIIFDDADLQDAHTVNVTKATDNTLGGSLEATITDPATGEGTGTISWTYSVANSATQYLAVGQTVTESFTVDIDDGNGGTASQEVIITITGTNDVPTITAGTTDAIGAVTEDATTPNLTDSGTITFNDIDLIDTHLTSVTPAVGNTLGGTLTLGSVSESASTEPGTVGWTYTVDNSATQYLAVGETVTESFTVTIDDQKGGTTSQVVTVTITGTNDGPVAIDNSYSLNEGDSVSGNLITDDANGSAVGGVDYDVDGDTLTITAINGVPVVFDSTGTAMVAVDYGMLEIHTDGRFTYTHDGSQPVIPTNFTYTITDGQGVSSTSTANVNMDVNNVNDVPVAVDNYYSLNEGTSVSGNLITDDANGATPGGVDYDLDGDTLTITEINGVPVVFDSTGKATVAVDYGMLEIHTDGTFTYTHDGSQPVIPTNFTYTITDGQGASSTSTANVGMDVNNVNDVPVAVDDSNSVEENASTGREAIYGVLSNDTDADGDTLTVTAIRTGTETGSGTAGTLSNALTGMYGTLILNTDGSYSYAADQPAADALAAGVTATDTFTYTMADGQGGSDTAELVITITGTNDAPVLDLDFDDSTAINADYNTSYTENGTPIRIADLDTTITDVDSANLTSATITLTNAKTGDVLTVGTLPASITASVVGNVVTLSGTASLTDYQDAIEAITFNTTNNISMDDRILTVVVTDGINNSNTATTTIDILPVYPSVTVNIVQDMMSDDQTSQVTFTFSEAVTDFTQTDLTVTGGTISMPVDSGDGIHWTAIFTPTPGYSGAAEVTVEDMSYYDLAGNAGSSGSDTVYISPISYQDADTGWLMNYNSRAHSFDMKVKGGQVTIAQGGTIYWDILVNDSNNDAALSFSLGKFDSSMIASYEQLYGADGQLIFRVYVTALTETILAPDDQFIINVLNASGDSLLLNSDEFVRPHSNYNIDYSDPATFDTGTAGAGADYDWLSPYSYDGDDVNGGEFSTGTITLQTGVTQHYGDSNDIVYGTTGHDELFGDAGHDFIAGRAGNDILHGGDGNDSLVGGYGNDVLYGDAGTDSLYGNESNDTLTGGLGNDILTGGDGADIFKWTSADITSSGAPFTDTITDFSIADGDRLDLTDVLTGEPANDLTSYLSVVDTPSGDVEVSVYADGVLGGTADMTIVIQNPTDSLIDLQNYLQNSTGVIH
ncbi:retention module-containing protein [Tolumonas auensis]|uniref:retention module-containing protein n=1 Tax=Tolumonas auensis TaxID=43948 RepID=UPI002AA6E354|nr:retention module-containing protein [Tolumonas auensis]